MPQTYFNQEKASSKKKFTVGLIVIFVLAILAISMFSLIKSNASKKDIPLAGAYIYMSALKSKKYSHSYKMVKNNQFSEEEYKVFVDDISQTVNLSKCLASHAPGSTIIVECPFVDKTKDKNFKITFYVNNPKGEAFFDSFKIDNQ